MPRTTIKELREKIEELEKEKEELHKQAESAKARLIGQIITFLGYKLDRPHSGILPPGHVGATPARSLPLGVQWYGEEEPRPWPAHMEPPEPDGASHHAHMLPDGAVRNTSKTLRSPKPDIEDTSPSVDEKGEKPDGPKKEVQEFIGPDGERTDDS